MTKPTISNVLLDLDGTLTDPSPGFVGCIRYALKALGLPSPTNKKIASHIGPPLEETLMELLGPEGAEALPDAVRLFRERYTEVGLYENSVYEGVVPALETIGTNGQRIFLATSKPQPFAERILEHFGLSRFFAGVYGSQFDGTHADKRELLGFLLDQEAVVPSQAIMVGDRCHDIRAAKFNNMTSLGVLWGYGSEDELRGANADEIISCPSAMPRAVVI